jgi:hypothetical protein
MIRQRHGHVSSRSSHHNEIQLIGRWESDAFMRYIREQVDCFTENISSKMLIVKSFYTIPNTNQDQTLKDDSANIQNGPSLSKVFGALVL